MANRNVHYSLERIIHSEDAARLMLEFMGSIQADDPTNPNPLAGLKWKDVPEKERDYIRDATHAFMTKLSNGGYAE